MTHKEWPRPEGLRDYERQEMIQYVEGYILALNDVLQDLAEVHAPNLTPEGVKAAIRAKIQDSLRQARASLRLWKGTDEQTSTGTTTN